MPCLISFESELEQSFDICGNSMIRFFLSYLCLLCQTETFSRKVEHMKKKIYGKGNSENIIVRWHKKFPSSSILCLSIKLGDILYCFFYILICILNSNIEVFNAVEAILVPSSSLHLHTQTSPLFLTKDHSHFFI